MFLQLKKQAFNYSGAQTYRQMGPALVLVWLVTRNPLRSSAIQNCFYGTASSTTLAIILFLYLSPKAWRQVRYLYFNSAPPT